MLLIAANEFPLCVWQYRSELWFNFFRLSLLLLPTKNIPRLYLILERRGFVPWCSNIQSFHLFGYFFQS